MKELFYLLIAAAAAAWWWQTRQAKQWALQHAWQRCRALNLQLLDQSVVLQRSRLRRDAHGRLCWQRHYQFEFSSTGDQRYRGALILTGAKLLHIELEPHILQEEPGQ